MVRSGRRLALAGALAAILLGVVLHAAELHLDADADGPGSHAAAISADATSGSNAVAALRSRSSTGSELLSLGRLSKGESGGLASLAVGAAFAFLCWFLVHQDRRFGPPLRGSMLAALRAPPARPAV